MELRSIEDRVKSGVEFMDGLDHNWRRKINKQILNMDDPETCILGQYSDMSYFEFVCAVGLSGEFGWRQVDFGFESVHSRREEFDSAAIEYKALKDEWLKYL